MMLAGPIANQCVEVIEDPFERFRGVAPDVRLALDRLRGVARVPFRIAEIKRQMCGVDTLAFIASAGNLCPSSHWTALKPVHHAVRMNDAKLGVFGVEPEATRENDGAVTQTAVSCLIGKAHATLGTHLVPPVRGANPATVCTGARAISCPYYTPLGDTQ